MTVKLLKATHKGPLRIGDIEIQSYVLKDGRRVLSQSGLLNALGMSTGGAKTRRVHRLVEFIGSNVLKRFINKELTARTEIPITFIAPHGGRPTYGYEATILSEICESVLAAREAGFFQKQQKHIADRAEILLRGFAQVGIIALVDEATGYQEYRKRHALEEILDRFIAKELRPWTKTFPDEFYENIFRLRGWKYDPKSVKRPILIGKITNDLIYDRLAPGVLDELKRVTPKDSKGRLKHHYHRKLTEDIGHPKLREHIAAVMAIQRAVLIFGGWRKFYSLMARSLPKRDDTLDLGLDLNGDE